MDGRVHSVFRGLNSVGFYKVIFAIKILLSNKNEVISWQLKRGYWQQKKREEVTCLAYNLSDMGGTIRNIEVPVRIACKIIDTHKLHLHVSRGSPREKSLIFFESV